MIIGNISRSIHTEPILKLLKAAEKLEKKDQLDFWRKVNQLAELVVTKRKP